MYVYALHTQPNHVSRSYLNGQIKYPLHQMHQKAILIVPCGLVLVVSKNSTDLTNRYTQQASSSRIKSKPKPVMCTYTRHIRHVASAPSIRPIQNTSLLWLPCNTPDRPNQPYTRFDPHINGGKETGTRTEVIREVEGERRKEKN